MKNIEEFDDVLKDIRNMDNYIEKIKNNNPEKDIHNYIEKIKKIIIQNFTKQNCIGKAIN